MLFQLVLVLCGRVLEMTGEILGRVRKEGSKMVLFTMRTVWHWHWSRSAGDIVQSPSLAVFKTGA